MPTIGYPLVWDDVNSLAQAEGPLLSVFGKRAWEGGTTAVLGSAPYYRPLTELSLRVDHRIGAGRAYYPHLVNLLLHALAAGLLVVAGLRLTGAAAASGLTGALFALHPLLADSVAYVSGRTDLLAAVGLLTSLIALIAYLQRPSRIAAVVCWSGALAAGLAKESALFFVAVVVVWVLQEPGGFRTKGRVSLLAGLMVVAAVLAWARVTVLGSLPGMRVAGGLGIVLLVANGLGHSLGSFILPFGSRVFVWNPAFFSGLTPYLLLAAAYLGLLWPLARRRAHPGTAFWVWGLVTLIPGTALLQFGPTGRLLYLPAVGLLLLILVCVQQVLRGRARAWPLLGVASVVLAAAFVPFLLARQRAWRSEVALFDRMAAEAPGYAPAHYNKGIAYLAAGDTGTALGSLRRAVALDSGIAPACLNLGVLEQNRGDLAAAAALFRRAIRARPGYAAAHTNLGVVLHRLGDDAGALAAFRHVMELDPANAGAAYNAAWLLALSGQRDSGLALALRAQSLQPADPRIRALVRALTSDSTTTRR